MTKHEFIFDDMYDESSVDRTKSALHHEYQDASTVRVRHNRQGREGSARAADRLACMNPNKAANPRDENNHNSYQYVKGHLQMCEIEFASSV